MVLAFSFRLPHWGISIVAGLTAALAFLAAGNGGLISFLLANFAPLPLMIAAMGWTVSTGLLASLFAGLIVFTLTDGQGAVEFLSLVAFPAVGLAALAQRKSKNGTYYPIGRLLSWIGWVAVFTTMTEIALWSSEHGGYSAASGELAQNFVPILQDIFASGLKLPNSIEIDDVAAAFAQAVPFFSVIISTLLLVANMWCAARAVQVSGRLVRPFPQLPEAVRLPRHILVIFGLGCAGLLIAGQIQSPSLEVSSGMIVAGMSVLFALQGMAVLHSVTRNLPFRGLLLTFIYCGIIVLSLWPLMIAAVVGFADSLVSLRRVRPVTENSQPKGE